MKLGAVVRRDQPRPTRLAHQAPRNGLPFVLVTPDVLSAMHEHATEGFPDEIGGYAVGLPLIDTATGVFGTYIERVLRAESISTHTHVTFLHESMALVDQVCAETGLLLVGYYHSHPGFRVFQSGEDVQTFSRYYAEPYQIAIVVDPTRAKADHLPIAADWIGFFAWDRTHAPARLPAANLTRVIDRPAILTETAIRPRATRFVVRQRAPQPFGPSRIRRNPHRIVRIERRTVWWIEVSDAPSPGRSR
ncbi:MAG: Mov34/MPN/PAD-1 family protein [Thermomicrobiales bacterium]